MDLEATYQRRFSPDIEFRQEMWRVLCEDFFQQFIPPESRVLEIGAGYCEFINNIQAAHKTAVDMNPETQKFAAQGVQVILTDVTNMVDIDNGSADIIFASNFFEHLERESILATLRQCHRILVPEGKFIILQPNIRFCQRDYWMFFDHITPIDDRGLTEALEVSGYAVTRVIDRFLPFTTKSRLPKSLFLLRAYLRLPLAWKIFGAQALLVAQPA